MKAFPSEKKLYWLFRQGDKPIPNDVAEQGMDLRDYFAANATNEDIKPYINDWNNKVDAVYVNSQGECLPTKEPGKRSREAAKYLYADAMMKAREQ